MMRHLFAGLTVILGLAQPAAAQPIIRTVAGGGPDGIPAVAANIGYPSSVTTDGFGNYYVTASLFPAEGTSIVYRVSPSGLVSIVAGTGMSGFSGDGGPAVGARLNFSEGLAADATGNLFIADRENNRIRRVDVATGIITTVAGSSFPGGGGDGDGGPATSASLYLPTGVKVDAAGNLLISDTGHHRIRRVDAVTGIITTVAGSFPGYGGDGGPATSAQLSSPKGLALDASGNLFIADRDNQRVRRVDAASGTITTVAGNGDFGSTGDGGPATSAGLFRPVGVALDASGNLLIAEDIKIRRVDAVTRIITTAAGGGFGSCGDGGPATSACFVPAGVATDAVGNIFIPDMLDHRVRRVDAATGNIATAAGNGTFGFGGDGYSAVGASVSPGGVAVDAAGGVLIADQGSSRVRRVDAITGIISTVAGNGSETSSGDGGPATSASFFPITVALDSDGNLFITDGVFNHRIRRVDAGTGIITTVAGIHSPGFDGDGGPATLARLNEPYDMAVDRGGNLFIADSANNRIRRVDAGTGIISTVAGDGVAGFGGDGGPATLASLNWPVDVALDPRGGLLIVDNRNNRVRRVDPVTGIITTVAGNGQAGFGGDGGPAASASLKNPWGVVADLAGNLFIADTSNHRIRRVDAVTRNITTVAGSGIPGFSGDNGPAANASLNEPHRVAVLPSGQLLISDISNRRLRMVISCQDRLDLGYSAGTLNLGFNLMATDPAVWKSWLVVQGSVVPLWSISIPTVPSEVSFTVPISPFPQVGNVGVLTTLTTPSFVCADWKTVNTGGAGPTVDTIQELMSGVTGPRP